MFYRNVSIGWAIQPGRIRPRAASIALWPRFRALGDATRAEIVALLAAARAPLCGRDVEAHFALAQPTISHHLRILVETEVLRTERRGARVYYSIDDALIEALQHFVHDLRG